MPLNNACIIKVPASTANLGPGFDSIGVAFDLYLTLEVENSDYWEVVSNDVELRDLPTNEEHFICRVAIKTAEKYGVSLAPCRLKMTSEIPLARGLGSSAAAIIAGIELADYKGNLGLTKQEKLLIATEMEGHPDNVGASLYGGMVVGSYQQDEVDLLSFNDLKFEVVVIIPEETLLTKISREVIPDHYSRHEAIQASSTANVLVAALLTQNWGLAGRMMERDLFHQPYRKPLVKGYEEIERFAKRNGAFGVALSGAGPSMLCLVDKGKGMELADALKTAFFSKQILVLNIENKGSHVCLSEEYIK